MRTVWASNGFDSVFAPAGAIGVREENCVLDPSRIRILGLAFGYRSPCHYGRVCSKLGSRSCSFDHGGASGSEDEDAAAVCAGATRKRKRKRKSPSALRSGQVRRRSWQHQQRGQGSTCWCLQFCFHFVLLRCLAPVVAPRARHSLRAMSRWSIGVAKMSQ